MAVRRQQLLCTTAGKTRMRDGRLIAMETGHLPRPRNVGKLIEWTRSGDGGAGGRGATCLGDR